MSQSQTVTETTRQAVAALIQRIESMEKQVSGFHNSAQKFQRIDGFENVILGLRHQVDNLGAQLASFPLQVKSVVAHAVQEQMTFVWDQQMQLVQQHAASCGNLEEKLQRHETQLEYHEGWLQDILARKADKNPPVVLRSDPVSDQIVDGYTTVLGTLGYAQAPSLNSSSAPNSGAFEPPPSAHEAWTPHPTGYSTPTAMTAPSSPWSRPATARGNMLPPGANFHTLPSEPATASGASPGMSSQGQSVPDDELQESALDSANSPSSSAIAVAGAEQAASQNAVTRSTDVASDGEATFSAAGSVPEKFGEDNSSDAPSGTHSIASAGARYGWPLQPKSLFHAINSKDEAMVLAILACPDFVELNATNEHGCTALHRAAWHGLAEACQALLDRPEFNAGGRADANGWTALHCAGARGQLEACRVLLRYPSSAAAALEQDRCGCTPLHRAVLSGRGEVCRLLLRHPSLCEDCPAAADGRTALHCAASGGHAEACLVLLDYPCGRASLNTRDTSGCIPVDVALGKAKQVLVDAGKRLNS